MSKEFIIQIDHDSDDREDSEKEMTRIQSSDKVEVKKEIEYDTFKAISVSVEDEEHEKVINGLASKKGVIIEPNQRFHKMDYKPSKFSDFWNWASSFFFQPNDHTDDLANVDFPELDLGEYLLGTSSIDYEVNRNLWGMPASRCKYVWEKGYTGKGIKIAILDTGCVYHPDLMNNIERGLNTVGPGQPTSDFTDFESHGTHVAGTIAADNTQDQGVFGFAPQSSIIPIKVLGDDGYGSMDDIIEGLKYAKTFGADVVNMSLGGGNYSRILHNAIKDLTASGIVIVVASGNENSDVTYPAKYPEVIPVGSYNKYNKISSFSNHGPDMKRGLVGPGERIYSCKNTDKGYTYLSGTSMATPAVSGAVALLKQIDKDLVNTEVVRQSLTKGAVKIIGVGDDYQGNGKLDLVNSIIECNKSLSDQINPPEEEEYRPVSSSTRHFGIGCTGEIVKQIQIGLKAKNLYKGAIDGIYGNMSAGAVLKLTDNQKNYVDESVWNEIIHIEFPSIFRTCLGITAAFEGTGYTDVVGNFDGAILTYGIIGFNIKYGSLPRLLVKMELANTRLIDKAFQGLAREVRREIQHFRDTGNLQKFHQWGLSIQDNGKVRSTWKAAFKNLGNIAEGRAIQEELAKEEYWTRALSLKKDLELKDDDLNYAICFDASVQGFNRTGKKQASKRIDQGLRSGRISSEVEKRKIIATANAESCNPRWKQDVWARKKGFITGKESVKIHGRRYILENWGLQV